MQVKKLLGNNNNDMNNKNVVIIIITIKTRQPKAYGSEIFHN